MQIRKAKIEDAEGIKNLYLQAFNNLEADTVSNLAVSLLHDSTANLAAFVAIDNDAIIAHTTFSPVFLENINEHFGYILAPLAVSPVHQKKRVGSTIVKYGLDTIASSGTSIVFVYGDPQYYSRFGFKSDLAHNFTPPHTLRYPEGWQAMKLNDTVFPEGGKLRCINSLNNPQLW